MKIFKIFSKKKEEIRNQYSFSEWRNYIDSVLKSSYESIHFDVIRDMFPEDYSIEYNPILADSIEKLETFALKKIINLFNNKWKRGIEENDITLVYSAWNELDVSLKECLFYKGIESFPTEISEQLDEQVFKVGNDIQHTCEKSIKQAESECESVFLRDLYYLIRKNRLLK